MNVTNARKRETFKGLELTEATTLGELAARFRGGIYVQQHAAGEKFEIKPGHVVLLDESHTVKGVMPLESFKRDFVSTTEPEAEDDGLGL